MQLQGKVVAVTGAFGQLGRAVAAELRAQGARVALLDRAAGEAPPDDRSWAVDLASLAETSRVMAEAASHFGGIAGLVNVAGGFRSQTLADSEDLAEWSAMHVMNLQTCVSACRAALPHLRRAGAGGRSSTSARWALCGAPPEWGLTPRRNRA